MVYGYYYYIWIHEWIRDASIWNLFSVHVKCRNICRIVTTCRGLGFNSNRTSCKIEVYLTDYFKLDVLLFTQVILRFYTQNMYISIFYPFTCCFIKIVYLIRAAKQENRSSGFRQVLTQTSLYSHRERSEAWKFVFRKKRDCTIQVAKTKALISFAVTAKLICAFVFAQAKIWFSHGAARMILSDFDILCKKS